MGKYGFVIRCFEKQIALKTVGVTKWCPYVHLYNRSPPSISLKNNDVWADHDHDFGLVDFEVGIEGGSASPPKIVPNKARGRGSCA